MDLALAQLDGKEDVMVVAFIMNTFKLVLSWTKRNRSLILTCSCRLAISKDSLRL